MAAKAHSLFCATAALLLAVSPALAGKTAVGGIGGLPVFVPDLPQAAPAGGVASLATPGAVTSQIEAATRFCARLPEQAYVVDCMAERLDAISRAMPSTGDLAQARTLLAEASRDLAELARANADTTLPRATARVPGGTATRRALVPVNPARQAAARSQAAAILERTETLLLRSANRPVTMAGYRQIAGAVGSAKVLLRST
ncbi:MAG: hypothetical protein ACK4RN_05955 [Pseudorhodobacter sp.]